MSRVSVKLGDIPAGPGNPPVFLAEVGALFNRDLGLARRLIDQIAAVRRPDSVVPVVLKGEILHDPNVCLDDETVETYQSKSGERKVERYRDLIERKALSLDEYRHIFSWCREADLPVVMSTYDAEGADFARAEGVAALKVASSNITHIPLIRHMASLGLPLIIDTGRASLAEIDHAFRAARAAGCEQVILEHSPDGHPAPPENHNLRSLATLSQSFGVPVGLSDHYQGTEMLFVAVGLGADLLEKNVVQDDARLEQDYAFAVAVTRLNEIVDALGAAWSALGAPFRDPSNTRGLIATSTRMGLVTRRRVRAEERIGPDTVTFAFPCRGIGAERFDDVSGWHFIEGMPTRTPITWQDVRA